MKSIGHGSSQPAHVVNQYPIPDDPPPFKPISSYNAPFEQYGPPQQLPFEQYGPPQQPSPHSYTSDHFSDYSHQQSVAVHPKAYEAYHSMMLKETNRHNSNEQQQHPNFVTLPPILGALPQDGLEIQKSIQYEITL